jgi:hypothetical protein
MNNRSRNFWTDERRAQLCSLAVSGLTASEIGAIIGTSKQGILTCCSRRNIDVVKHTEIELTDIRDKDRAREKRKRLKKQATRSPLVTHVTVAFGTSRTAPIYRNQFPRIPEMTKNALREMFAQAVRNTAGMAT